MSPTLKDLLPPDQQPLTIQPHESVMEAIERLRAHQYNQLPVVDEQGRCRGEVVTYETILHAALAFETEPAKLKVKDATKRVPTYGADDDLLTTLDAIQRSDFALILGEDDKLTGIVTTADTTAYFHKYAGDLMMIEGVEVSIKEAIEILYGGLQEPELTEAIESVTDRASDTRKKLPAAIKAYLSKMGVTLPVGDEAEALAIAEAKLNLPKAGKPFDRLTFDEYTEILLRHAKAPRVGETDSAATIRKLLHTVRDARNKLAHFRGDVTIRERADIKFAAEWLERHQPTPLPLPPPTPTPPPPDFNLVVTNPPYENKGEEDSVPQGKYAALSKHLREMDPSVQSCVMTFAEIERLLNEKFPESAYEYRAWWANDPSKPHAAGWLSQGWKAQSLSMSEKRLTFVRTDDRQQAYIAFFSRVNGLLEEQNGFPLRNLNPQGQNWHTLASLQSGGMQTADIICAFVRQDKFRVELYLDDSDADANMARFDLLHARGTEFEEQFGEPLEWERLEGRRACRVATYRKASILNDSDSQEVMEWTVRKALDLYRVFAPEFSTPDPHS
jgi:CBS domain-containing protein